jgi:hypothetical protein
VLEEISFIISVGIVIYYLLGIKLISFFTIQKAINKPPITYRYGSKLSTIGEETAPTEASNSDPVVVENNISLFLLVNKTTFIFNLYIFYYPLKIMQGQGGGLNTPPCPGIIFCLHP